MREGIDRLLEEARLVYEEGHGFGDDALVRRLAEFIRQLTDRRPAHTAPQTGEAFLAQTGLVYDPPEVVCWYSVGDKCGFRTADWRPVVVYSWWPLPPVAAPKVPRLSESVEVGP